MISLLFMLFLTRIFDVNHQTSPPRTDLPANRQQARLLQPEPGAVPQHHRGAPPGAAAAGESELFSNKSVL